MVRSSVQTSGRGMVAATSIHSNSKTLIKPGLSQALRQAYCRNQWRLDRSCTFICRRRLMMTRKNNTGASDDVEPALNSGTFLIGDELPVRRLGFGAMRLT